EAAVSPLVGSYNAYNAVASFYTASILGIDKKTIIDGLSHVKPAFGRQEEFQKNGRTIKIFLSKNPTGMNESLRTIKDLSGKYLLFLLNDRIPDGKDVSWIWDVDIEHLVRKDAYVFASGDRAFDMGLRFKYAEKWQIERGKPAFPAGKWQIDLALENAYEAAMHQTPAGETLYIVPTYSAMLEIRKLLTGRKIL
ncbi:MAG: MurT ligase domain-containing protein, partial [bacterium]|nr:MurT ligase domain-containing protein [bacterium]